MAWIGDIRLGDTFDTKFCTVTTTGAPTQLAGTPVISAYVGNSVTQITAGITLTVDFDAVTGLNNVRVVASGANGFATASNYQLVITTGTVGGTSVVGYVVAEFSIEARSAVMPTTAARTLDVSAGGEAGVDWANVGTPSSTVNLSATTTNVVNTATAVTTVNGLAANVVTAAATAADFGTEVAAAVWNEDATGHQTQGTFGQAIGDPVADTNTIYKAVVTDAAGATVGVDVVAVKAETASIQVDTDDIQTRLPAALVSGRMSSDAVAISGDTVAADNAEAFFDNTGFAASASTIGTVNLIAANGITSASFAAGATAVASGTADSGSTTTMVDAARTEADTDYWKGAYILFTSGTISGQCRQITAFTPASDTITFAPATTQAVGVQTYEIFAAAAVDVRLWNGTAPNNLIAGRVDADAVVTTNNDKTGYSIGMGGIASTAFAAGAIDATAIAADAIGASEVAAGAWQEGADEFLNRNLAGGASGGARNVRNALRPLRNKSSIAAGTLTIFEEDDLTTAWTATVTTAAGNPTDSIDPA